MLERLQPEFPRFASLLADGYGEPVENMLRPLTDKQINQKQSALGVPLPESYRRFLRCTGGLWLLGGTIQFNAKNPFFHRFPALDALSSKQREIVHAKGGGWPPPSQGMLCFAEFSMEADGDQVLFDVGNGLIDGEYPVKYYAHAARPPSVRKLADSFEEFIESFLTYDAFADEDA